MVTKERFSPLVIFFIVIVSIGAIVAFAVWLMLFIPVIYSLATNQTPVNFYSISVVIILLIGLGLAVTPMVMSIFHKGIFGIKTEGEDK